MVRSPKPDWSAFNAWALVGQLGLAVATPIVAGVLIGRYMDDWLGSGGLILTLFLLTGIVCGILAAWRILSKVMGSP